MHSVVCRNDILLFRQRNFLFWLFDTCFGQFGQSSGNHTSNKLIYILILLKYSNVEPYEYFGDNKYIL
jgi:hypothetical protein